MSKYKYLVVSDLDGTLLNSEGKISQKTVDFVHKLNGRNDVLFTFSTGRSWQDSEWIYKELKLKGFISCSNGSHIYDPHQNIKIYSYLEHSIWSSILKHDDFFKNLKSGLIITDTEYLRFDDGTNRDDLVKKINEKSLNVYYLKFIFKDDKVNDFSSIANYKIAFLKELDHAPSVTVYENPELKTIEFEIQDHKTDKGKFIKFLNVYYGVPKSRIISLGDQINDLAMALGPSYFVTVKNGVFLLKSKSRRVSKFTNDEDAVIKEIDIFLQKQSSI